MTAFGDCAVLLFTKDDDSRGDFGYCKLSQEGGKVRVKDFTTPYMALGGGHKMMPQVEEAMKRAEGYVERELEGEGGGESLQEMMGVTPGNMKFGSPQTVSPPPRSPRS